MKSWKVSLKKNDHYQMGRRVRKVIGIALGVVTALALGVIVFYWVKSPGKMVQYLDDKGNVFKGSICKKEYVEINGTKMGMIIKSRDLSNPVLLFLHGGTGMPEYPITWDYPTGLEDYFTVVWWEQRGAGLSYNSKMDVNTLTTEQYIEDTIAMSQYLCRRFKTDKIYLMAHSAGTYTGIQAASRAPELYKAYIGMGQMQNYQESKQLAYEYMIDYYTKAGKDRIVKKLQTAYGTDNYDAVSTKYMCKAGIETTRQTKSQATGIFLPAMDNPEYTLREKINIWRGLLFCKKSPVEKDNRHVDLTKRITQLDIPVYFLSGKYDYIVNYKLSEDFLIQIKAPVKGFYLFKNSAHSPIFEEPEKVCRILNEDVKNGRNTLADVH